jgi:hypothetical protein
MMAEFRTIKGPGGEATSIRKGSKYDEQFQRSKKTALKQYEGKPGTTESSKGRRATSEAASSSYGANLATQLAKRQAERTKYKKGGLVK